MDPASPPTRSRGRGRGGRGKAVRARGRGGRGRAAEFAPRFVPEHEQALTEEEEEERQKEIREKYARRELTSNVHRYEDPPDDEKVDDPDAEPEPEVDLSSFLERQRLSDVPSALQLSSSGNDLKKTVPIDDDDIDHSLDHLFPSTSKQRDSKGKREVIEWDEETEAMRQAKDQAEAIWDLKQRLRGNVKTLASGTTTTSIRAKGPVRIVAPLLNQNGPEAKKDEEFLDDLLS